MYTPNFIEIGQTFLWTDVPTDRRTFSTLMLLGRFGAVDLTKKHSKLSTPPYYRMVG